MSDTDKNKEILDGTAAQLLDYMRALNIDPALINDPSIKMTIAQSVFNATLQSKVIEKVSMPLLDKIKAWIGANIFHKQDKDMDLIWDTIVAAGLITKDMAENMKKVVHGHPVLGQFLTMLTPVIVFVMQAFSYLNATRQIAAQAVNANLRPTLPDSQTVARAAFIDPESITRVREIMASNGIREKDIDLIFKSMYQTYDAEIIRNLYFRGEIDLNKVYIRMRENGYTDTRTAEILKTWELIPPVQDIIMMAVREAFSEEQVAELGLDLAFPPPVAEWGERLGLSKYWSKQYWRSHWQLPSPQMGFEMLHRGKISEEGLRGLIKALDYSPKWHDQLIAISYNVMTRVDARRLYELGILDDAGILKKYQEMGYSPADSELLVKWTKIEYNQEYRDITKSEVIKQYLEGIIVEGDARSLLITLGYTPDRIETMIALASYQRGYAKQGARIDALHKLYLTGQAGNAEVKAELEVFNIDERRIGELLDLWALEYKAGLKLPIRRELDDWLKKGIVSDREYTIEMLRNGYSQMHIDMFIKAVHYTAPPP